MIETAKSEVRDQGERVTRVVAMRRCGLWQSISEPRRRVVVKQEKTKPGRRQQCPGKDL